MINSEEQDILEYWFEKGNLSKATRKNYTISMNLYSKFIGKTIIELYKEADEEEERGLRLIKRKYSTYILKFQKHLRETNKSENTIRLYITGVKAFYRAHGIIPPEIKVKRGDIGLDQNYGHLLTKDEIRTLTNIANTRDKAIIYIMVLSGMSQKEVRDLSIKKFINAVIQETGLEIGSVEDLLNHEDTLIKDTVIMLEITRTKSSYRYHTFIPPETTKHILVYLRERINSVNKKIHINNLDDPLFVKVNGQKLTDKSVTKIFIGLGNRAGFKHEHGSYRSWRSHGLRKYFISTIINNTGDHILADYMAGHKINNLKRSYWFADPQKLKDQYLKALPYLSLEDVEVKTLESPEYQELKELKINSKAKDGEMSELKEEVANLKSVVEMLLDKDTKYSESFLEGHTNKK